MRKMLPGYFTEEKLDRRHSWGGMQDGRGSDGCSGYGFEGRENSAGGKVPLGGRP